MGQKAERFDIQLELEMEKYRALAQIDVNLERRLRKLEAESWGKQEKIYQQQVRSMDSWYRNPFLAATMGFVSGVLVVLLVGR